VAVNSHVLVDDGVAPEVASIARLLGRERDGQAIRALGLLDREPGSP
jgi:hypothetical protein